MSKMKITLEKKQRPIKIIQFGGGVFLRGFVDWLVQLANNAGVMNAGVAIVRSKTTGIDPLSEQCFNYTHLARDGEHNEALLIDSIVSSVSASEDFESFLSLAENPDTEVIVSNTTEAGIVYKKCGMRSAECGMVGADRQPNKPASWSIFNQGETKAEVASDACPCGVVGADRQPNENIDTFPARLCALLWRRFSKGLSPMLIIPCELIEDNGDKLKEIVIQHANDWELGDKFLSFIDRCQFRNTLVDRIVSGKPSENIDIGYEDACINTSEYFHLFVIEGQSDSRFPLDKISDGVVFAPSVKPYRELKVRILNGAHTSLIPYALTLGVQSVGECLENDILRAHLELCLDEILSAITTNHEKARGYADSVIKRFSNPYIYHRCDAIVLNSVSKYRVRVLPSVLDYEKIHKKAPSQLLFALSKLIELYKNGGARDDAGVVEYIKSHPVCEILSNTELWGCDLSRFESEVSKNVNS